MNPTPTQAQSGARYRGLIIIWGAQIASQVLLFLLARLAVADREGGDQTLLLVLAAVGLSTASLSFVLKPTMLARAAQQRRPEMVTTAYILAFALCESCALFGLVARFATGARESFYFFIPSALGLLLHFPRRRHLYDSAGDAPQTFKTTF
jgi:F0F1-type ATP synthase membrane subunit c/vacuolar-type H+-ATPase subunit K